MRMISAPTKNERMATGMDEYIEREKIREEYEKLTRSYVNSDPYIADWRFDEMIESLPSADVAPARHGRWENKNGLYSCSECGRTCPYDVQADVIEYWSCNYCPNCGAKMDIGIE